MAFRIFAGIVALTLFAGFVLPYVLKMWDIALGVVLLIGLSMMVWDLWESIREKED